MSDFNALGHGSTISFDRYGNLVDVASSLTERYSINGNAWILELPYTVLSADGVYASISFKTAATGRTYYALSDTSKTGNEVLTSIWEGGTYAGGTVLTPVNYDFTSTAASPFQNSFYGVSPAATLTGGTRKAVRLIGGSAQGNQVPGGNTQGQGTHRLKPDTVYTVIIAAKGGEANVASRILVAYLPD